MSSKSGSVYFGLSMVVVLVVAALVGLVYKTVVPGPGAVAAGGASVAERIAPVGSVTLVGAEPAAPAAAAPAAAGGGRSGEEIYNKVCVACHAVGVAGAPKFGNKEEWAPRIAKGIDGLMQSALNGLNAMPPRGTCSDCSDDELKATIEYMTSHAQ